MFLEILFHLLLYTTVKNISIFVHIYCNSKNLEEKIYEENKVKCECRENESNGI